MVEKQCEDTIAPMIVTCRSLEGNTELMSWEIHTKTFVDDILKEPVTISARMNQSVLFPFRERPFDVRLPRVARKTGLPWALSLNAFSVRETENSRLGRPAISKSVPLPRPPPVRMDEVLPDQTERRISDSPRRNTSNSPAIFATTITVSARSVCQVVQSVAAIRESWRGRWNPPSRKGLEMILSSRHHR